MGNGMPVGACWARRDVAAVFEPGDHGSTYSGTAIATAAVSAVIDEMRRIDAPALAASKGARLAAALADAARRRRRSAGAGLLLAAELDGRRRAGACTAGCSTRGLVDQRRHADRAALRPAAHGHRRRDRRGRRR